MEEHLFSVEITWFPGYLPNRREHNQSWVSPVYLQNTLFKGVSKWGLQHDIHLNIPWNEIVLLWDYILFARGTNDILSSSLALLCMYLKLMQSNAILPQLLFQLALRYPLSLLLTPSSNDTALPELSAGYVSPGVWIFYKCNCHIHMLLVQTEQVPLLWEVQITSLKVRDYPETWPECFVPDSVSYKGCHWLPKTCKLHSLTFRGI